MSNVLTNSLETKSYTLFLSSVDKIGGKNNEAQFNVNWADFLPIDYDTFKVTFSFQTGGGYYLDKTFTSATNTASSGSTTLTLNTVNTGVVVPGMILSGSAFIQAGTYIVSGPANGGTGAYVISKPTTGVILNTSIAGNVVYSGCKIVCDMLGRSYSFDSGKTGPSSILGYAQRDLASTQSTSNSFSAFYLQFPPKTISRPNQNLVTFSFYNLNNNFLLTDTTSTGLLQSDMTNWNIILEFTPCLTSANSLKKD